MVFCEGLDTVVIMLGAVVIMVVAFGSSLYKHLVTHRTLFKYGRHKLVLCGARKMLSKKDIANIK